MKNTTWQNIEPGQVVKFRYKGMKSNRGILREVIVLDPRYLYRKKSTGRIVELFIGLEIDNQRTPALRPAQIGKLLRILSGAGTEEGMTSGGQRARMKSVYKQLKPFLVQFPIFKTYLLRNCRRYRVFHENKKADLNKYMIVELKDEMMSDTQESSNLVGAATKAVVRTSLMRTLGKTL